MFSVTLFIFVSVYVSILISLVSICIFFIVLYIEGKHLTTIGNNVLLNTNYSQNTYLFMTYFPEPFHNKYKSDAYI